MPTNDNNRIEANNANINSQNLADAIANAIANNKYIPGNLNSDKLKKAIKDIHSNVPRGVASIEGNHIKVSK